MNRSIYICISFILTLTLPHPTETLAQTNDEMFKQMQAQLEQLQARLSEVEKRNLELEKRLSGQESQTTVQEERVDQIEHAVTKTTRSSITSQYGAEFYGYIKFDASYDTARTNVGNFARWVQSDSISQNDDQFNATANQSRFGLVLKGPEVVDAKTSGRVEVDFYGGGAPNKAHIMMRHAYMELEWLNHDLSLIAGQTSDVISPLVPTTVNYSVGWWAGDIGYRHPQIRLTKGFDFDNNQSLTIAGAVSRTIGENNIFGFGSDDTGEDAGFPTVQARLAYGMSLLTEKQTVLGISGHFGQEEYDVDASDNARDFDTWSLNADLTIPLTEKFDIKGEFFIGENLDDYLGGIAQGVNVPNLEGIRSKGGWLALSSGPWGKWAFNVGGSIDDPMDDDLVTGDREQNMSVFGNTFYAVNEAVLLGFEASYWDTKYKNREDGDSIRLQTSLMYTF